MLEMKQVYFLNKNIILRGINQKYWALNTKNGLQFRLNQLSFDILSSIDGKNPLELIVENLYKKYDVDRTRFDNDVIRFLENALQKGFILKE